MKIGFFNSSRSWGGGEKWHLETAIRLQKMGETVCICAHPLGVLAQKAKAQHLPTATFAIHNVSWLNPLLLKRLVHFFRQQAFDVVILNLPSDLKAAGIAAKHAGIPHIIYRRGSAIPIQNRWHNRFLFQNVITEIIANSQATKESILQKNPNLFPAEKIAVIYNGFDFEAFENLPVQPIFQRKDNELILGNAGRLARQKGQQDLIDLSIKLQKRNIPHRILIAGSGPLEQQLKKYAQQKNVENQIIFLGFQKNIRAFMEAIDVLVLPSRWEGFGYVLVEAMAAQKPALAYRLSSNSELIQDGENGFLVEPFTIDLLAEKISLLYHQPQLREKLGKKGRIFAEENFSFSRILEKLQNFLHNL